jgi:hypothetical protein
MARPLAGQSGLAVEVITTLALARATSLMAIASLTILEPILNKSEKHG